MGKKQTFAERIKERMGARVSQELTGGAWRGIEGYDHILKDKDNNFIDGKKQDKCDVKGDLFGADKIIEYHTGASHLNSSQVMCINFFKKFFEKERWEDILIKLLKNSGVPLTGNGIKEAVFEYVPYYREGTNFDFYLVLNDGSHVSMEIKYTEADFGKVVLNPKNMDTYSKKWTKVYVPMVEKSPYLACSMEELYENYQINRNILYARKGDCVLFLTPRANDAPELVEGRKYIDSLTSVNPRIKNIYWEDVVGKLMPLIENDSNLFDYYQNSKKKNIDIL
jgi:hypothetical protein